MTRIFTVWLTGLLLAGGTAWAEPAPLEWNGQDHLDVQPALEVVVLPDRRPPEDADWAPPSELESHGFDGDRGRLHFRARLHNTTDADARLWLHLGDPTLDELAVTAGGTTWWTGDHHAFNSRPIAHPDFLFPIELAAGETLSLSGWAESNHLRLPLTLWRPQAYLEHSQKITLRDTAFFTLMLLLTAFCVMFYSATRLRAYLSFAVFSLAVAVFFFRLFGYGFQFLWPRWPTLNDPVSTLSLYTLAFSFGWMAQTMLGSASRLPRLGWLMTPLLGILVVGGVVTALVADRAAVLNLPIYWMLVMMALVFAMLVLEIRGGSLRARLFAVAMAPMITAALSLLLATLGLLSFTERLMTLALAGMGLTSLTFFGLIAFYLRQSVLKRQRLEQESLHLKSAQAERLAQEVEERTHQLAETNRQLREMAFTDPLTGLPNRRQLDDFGELHQRLANLTGEPLQVAIFDLDHFKDVNDQYGHDIGDRFLKAVAEVLTRTIDSGKEHDRLVARLGGEEFALVAYGLAPEAMPPLLESVRQAVSEIREPAARDIRLTLSIGWASVAPEQSLSRAFRRADQALYRAKDAGRDRVEAA